MLFGHSEVHFWSYGGSENGKLKKISPKGTYPLLWPVWIWVFWFIWGWQAKVSMGGVTSKSIYGGGGLLATFPPQTLASPHKL